MKKVELNNFELHYDGMYWIHCDKHKVRIFIKLNTILRMLEIEGLGLMELDAILEEWKPINFKKVTISIWCEEVNGSTSYRTSDSIETYYDYNNKLWFADFELKN